MHLKAISQIAKVPRSVEEDFAAQGKANGIAGMTLSDDQYSVMLTNLLGMTGESLDTFGTVDMGPSGVPKRGLEEVEDDRDNKRGRFEVLE